MSHAPVPAEELLRHREWVRALARTLVRDDAAADDLAQDAWLAAVESPPRRTDAPRSWFARVLRTRAIDAHRASSSRGAREVAASRPESVPSAAETVAQAETHRRVVDAVLGLAEPYRTAVLLRYFEDLPPREVARRTGVPVETARTHVRRGVEQLREKLAPAGDERRRGALLALAAGPRTKARVPPGGAAVGGGLVAIVSKQSLGLVAAAVLVGAAAVAVVARGVSDGEGARESAEAAATPRGVSSAPTAVRAARPAVPPVEPADATPVTSSPETAARTRLRIRREDGGPLEGAEFALFDAARVHARGRLAADAIVDAEPADHARRLVVAPPESAQRVVVVAAGTTESEIVLPTGATVAGRVEIEGGLPGRRLRVWLTPDEPVVPPDAIPAALRADAVVLAAQVPVRVAADGTFRVPGLEPGARGTVQLPWEFEPQATGPGDDPGRFVAPCDGLRLRGRARLPHVAGRLVRKGTGQPLRAAAVSLHGGTERGEWSVRMQAEDDGTFALAGGDVSSASALLRVREEGGVGAFELTIPGPLDRAIDVGDVAVPDPWESAAALRVVDPGGRPVVGAVAFFEDGSQWVSRPSGADGRIAVPLGGTSRRVVVTAPGFAWLAVEPSATGAEPARVELPLGTLLEIEFRAARSALPRGVRVRVSGRAGALFDEPAAACEIAAALGLTSPVAATRDADGADFSLFDASAAHAEAGRVAVGFLRAGTPIRVEATDEAGHRLFTTGCTLASGERRTVAIDVPAFRTWRGRVVDPAGRPVGGAVVCFRDSERGATDEFGGRVRAIATSGTDGRFSVAGLAATSLDVVVSAPGFVPRVLRGTPVGAGSGETPERVVRLETGRRLTVRILGGSRAVEGIEEVFARPEGLDPEGPFGPVWEADWPEDAVRVLDGLPAGPVEVVVRRGAREDTVRTTADAGTVDVVLDDGEE